MAGRSKVQPELRSEAYLDELLTFEEAEPVQPAWNGSRPWLIVSALQTFAASAVLYTGFRVVNLAPPYALLVAVCAGFVLVRQAVVATREPKWRRTRDVVRPARPALDPETGLTGPDGGDGMLDAVGRWDRRLDWGTTTPQRFDATVGRRLAEITDERLRQRYGLTRSTDPARARELVGDDLWALVHGPYEGVPAQSTLRPRREEVPRPGQVAAALQRLEAL